MPTADEAARQLAEQMLRMRIEVRKMAFTNHGRVQDVSWMRIYEAIRQYEDAQVQDMLRVPGRSRRKKKRVRRDEEKAKAVRVEARRKPKPNHPWRKNFPRDPNAQT